MRQKLSLGAAMALVVALAVLTFGPSLAAGTGEDQSLVLRAHEDQSAEIDVGDKSLSLGDQLVFSVADRGPGIVEDDVRRLRQRIFAASRAGDLRKVRNLQKLMVRHEARVSRMGVKDRHRLIVVAVG